MADEKPNLLTRIFMRNFLGNKSTKKSSFDKFKIKRCFFENIYLSTRDNKKIGCYVFAPLNINGKTKIIIFLHGRNYNRKGFAKLFNMQYFTDQNFICLFPDYRSFGDSEGMFSTYHVNFDIEAVHIFCLERYQIEPIFFGFELGGAIALEYLSYTLHNNKIILIDIFTNLIVYMEKKMFYRFMIKICSQLKSELSFFMYYNNNVNIRYAEPENVIILQNKRCEGLNIEEAEIVAKEINCSLKIINDKYQKSFVKHSSFCEIFSDLIYSDFFK
ncbi:hypothetical protein GVAV_001088 [Gurleya vavrai]